MSRTISITEARDDFADVMNQVAYGHERVLVERRGRSLAAIIPAEDLMILEAIEDEIDIAEARAALADPSNATPLRWSDVKARLGL